MPEPELQEDQEGDENEAVTYTFHVEPPFRGGYGELSVSSGYVRHVAVSPWTSANNVSIFIFLTFYLSSVIVVFMLLLIV